MDFRFDIDKLLPEEITCVDNSLIIPAWKSSTRNRLEYQQLFEVINVIGEASSFSQSLNRVITNSEKLQGSDHILYLMKEYDKISGRTLLVGMLKIGRKKLFLLDPKKTTKEVAPLCVLDFYIHESRQRRGYGRKLFNHMLMHQNVDPGHLAVDKPSDKFLAFLHRHYGLYDQVPQINNFVVYTSFFEKRPMCQEESVLVNVNKSNRSSRTASPDTAASSPGANGSRRGSSHFAGKPSRIPGNSVPLHNSYRDVNARNLYLDQYYTSEILYGNEDRMGPSGKMNSSRQHVSLDWMRGGNSSLYDRSYGSRNSSYNASPLSRTPGFASPLSRTPGFASPKKSETVTPTGHSRNGSRRDSLNSADNEQELLRSIVPTPATSPERRSSHAAVENGRSEHNAAPKGKIDQQAPPPKPTFASEDEVDYVNGKMERMGIQPKFAPPSEVDGQMVRGDQDETMSVVSGKTGSWRDNISRNSEGLIEHMSSVKGTSSGGVLNDDDSVHGHLKFHHHALW